MHLDFGLQVKEVSEAGLFEGLASVYGNVDAGNDLVEPGAFTDTLAKRGSELPVLWAHQMTDPIGLGTLSDAPEGLRIRGMLDLDTQAGREAHSRLKKKIVRGLSIGYKVPDGGSQYKDGVRRLKRLDLYEVSLVAVPMNDQARVTAVKSGIASIRDFEQALRSMGYSKSEAAKLAGHGWKGLALPDEPEPDPAEQALAEWLAERKSNTNGFRYAR